MQNVMNKHGNEMRWECAYFPLQFITHKNIIRESDFSTKLVQLN